MTRCFRCGTELDEMLCMGCATTAQNEREQMQGRLAQVERDIQRLDRLLVLKPILKMIQDEGLDTPKLECRKEIQLPPLHGPLGGVVGDWRK